MTTTVDLGELLSNEQAAAILGVKPNTLEVWRCKGKGPAFLKLGEHPSSPIRYQRSRVMEWLRERTFTSTTAYTVAHQAA